jgi:hypothetical protein
LDTLRSEVEIIESQDSCNTLTKCPFYPKRCKYCKSDRIMAKVRLKVKDAIANLKLDEQISEAL